MIYKINKRLYNFIILFISIFCTDIILKLVNNSNIFNWAMFRIFLSSVLISYFLSYFVTKFKEKTMMIINIVLAFLVSLYAILQIGFSKYIGTYMSFNSTSQAYKVMDFLFDFLGSINILYYLLFIPFILIISYYLIILPYLKKKVNLKIIQLNHNKHLNIFLRGLINVSVTLFLMFIYYLSLIAPFMQSRYQFEKNIDLFRNPDNQSVAVDQFGVTMFFIIDLNSFIFPSEAPIEHIVINPPKETIVETDDSRIIDDSIWEAIIENEKNTRLKQINSYFINRRITERNEYTGLFKDKNLILIMMESISLLGINEEYFPNLYKLWNEGISFNNFYSPRNSCPTGNNEMTALVGLYTINNSCTANTYRKNIYPQALFNKFKESGYYASSYHNYVDQYYYRNDIHLNSGSQKYYNAQALKIKVINKQWPSDVELFEKGLPNFINEDRFMSLMTTVTAHAPYNVGSIYGNKNFDLFKDLNITNSLKRYYSKVYELDQGIKYLLEELERTNKLDDTVIILFGDHQPYSLGVKQQVDVLGEEAGKNKNIEKTPLIIYNSQIQGKIIDDYVSIIDLAPTILNLFDLDYDPRYYVGEDIFDPNSEKRAIFTDGSWQDEVGFFNASNDNFILNDPDNEDVGYSDEEIIEINTVINLKQKMSNLAIKSNYFYHLEQARKKYINN